jgi:predicted nucleic acid-binding protein
MGTLGVLAQAAIQNLVNVEKVTAQLRQTNFRGRIELIQELVEEHRRRGSG